MNPLSSFLDQLASLRPRFAFEGPCGLLNGKVIRCFETLKDAVGFWTHPLALDPEIEVMEAYPRLTLRAQVKNFFGTEATNIVTTASVNTFHDIYVSGEVINGDNSCQLGFQKISIAPGEAQDVLFFWNITRSEKNTPLTFRTDNWYDCHYTCCPPDASFCSCNPQTGEGIFDEQGCALPSMISCGPEDAWPRGGGREDFLVENQPPIINSIRCTSPQYLGVDCPANLTLAAGDALNIEVIGHDLDDPSFEINYAGDYPGASITKTCEVVSDSPFGQRCLLTFQTLPEHAGAAYWMNIIASDGLNSSIKTFNFKISSDCDQSNPALWQWLRGYQDSDGDSYTSGRPLKVCSGVALPVGYRPAPHGNDCDDHDQTRWRYQALYRDADKDTYFGRERQRVCMGNTVPAGYSQKRGRGIDCNDANRSINPAAREVCDRIDNNCNGRIDEGLRCSPQR